MTSGAATATALARGGSCEVDSDNSVSLDGEDEQNNYEMTAAAGAINSD